MGGSHDDVTTETLDNGLEESEFKFQSRSYVYFRANTLGKNMKPFILPTPALG